MLRELYLRNYILIDELKLTFRDGMSVLSGETGAGKSILVGALNLVFGKSGVQNIAQKPEKDVNVEMTFSVSESYYEVHKYLDDVGFPAENNEIVIAKEINLAGKSVSFLNGRKTTSNVLKDLYNLLIDFHHQRDQQNLLNSGFQLDLLDSFAGLWDKRNSFKEKLRLLKTTIQKLQTVQQEKEQNLRLIELYKFQFEELNSANLIIGEDTELEQEFALLSHSEEIIQLSTEAFSSLYEREGSSYDNISCVVSRLQKYADFSTKVTEVCLRLESCLQNVQDAANELRNLRDQINSDPVRLEEIQHRLDTLNTLKTKYKKNSIQELISYKNSIEEAINNQESKEEDIAHLTEFIGKNFDSVKLIADELSSMRITAAHKLEKDIVANIKKLSIPNAKFEIEIDKINREKIILTDLGKAYTDCGQDTVEFRFSANPGSPVLPLKAIVSGGELSRILLATKKSLAAVMPPRTMILDEIDSGIGGKTAGTMANFIHELAADYQILCITHLAKIAACADWHYTVEKLTGKSSTSVKVQMLSEEERIEEIARMLSGEVTDLSKQHADELIKSK